MTTVEMEHALPNYAEALELAGGEYGFYRSEFGGYGLTSRGADGGMHYRASARSAAEARAWRDARVVDLARRVAAGDVTGTLLFWGGAGWYIG